MSRSKARTDEVLDRRLLRDEGSNLLGTSVAATVYQIALKKSGSISPRESRLRGWKEYRV